MLGNKMFAYCRNNPVCRKDISGRDDVECTDLDNNEFTDNEDYFGGGGAGTGAGAPVGTNTGSGGGNSGGGQASGGQPSPLHRAVGMPLWTVTQMVKKLKSTILSSNARPPSPASQE